MTNDRDDEDFGLLRRQVTLKFKPSYKEVEEMFWGLDDTEQALFFNELNTRPSLAMQLQFITDNQCLNNGGRNAMALIGEYSLPTKKKVDGGGSR